MKSYFLVFLILSVFCFNLTSHAQQPTEWQVYTKSYGGYAGNGPSTGLNNFAFQPSLKDVASQSGLQQLTAQIVTGLKWVKVSNDGYALSVRISTSLHSFVFKTQNGSTEQVNIHNTPALRPGRFSITGIVWELVNEETNTRKRFSFSLTGNWMQWQNSITADEGDVLYRSEALIFRKKFLKRYFSLN